MPLADSFRAAPGPLRLAVVAMLDALGSCSTTRDRSRVLRAANRCATLYRLALQTSAPADVATEAVASDRGVVIALARADERAIWEAAAHGTIPEVAAALEQAAHGRVSRRGRRCRRSPYRDP